MIKLSRFILNRRIIFIFSCFCSLFLLLIGPWVQPVWSSSSKERERKVDDLLVKRKLLPKRKLPPKLSPNGSVIGLPVGTEGPKVRQKSVVQRMRNTTTPDLPVLFKKYVQNFYSEISESSISTAHEHSSKFPSNEDNSPRLSSLLTFVAEGANHPEIKLSYDKSITTDIYKNLEEKKNKDYFEYDENYLKELFDILIIISPLENNLDYLQEWKPLLEHFHCILLEQGDSHRDLRIPDWLEYELHNQQSAELSLKNIDSSSPTSSTIDFDLLFDFQHSNHLNSTTNIPAAILNFGFLVADRDFIFILNSQMKPKFRNGGDPFDLLRIHAYNLLLPTSSTSYYNNRVDPFKRNKDFIRGVPYSQRIGMETVLSYATIINEDNEYSYDQMTNLVKKLATKGLEHLPNNHNNNPRRSLRTQQHDPLPVEEQEKILSRIENIHESTTLPVSKGMYFTLSFDSLAFNRKAIGPIFCFFNGIETKWNGSQNPSKLNYINGHYYHILLGWMMKSIFDRLNLGVKHFDASPYLQPMTLPSSSKKEFIVKELENDLLWQEKAESLYYFVTTFRFPNTTASLQTQTTESAADAPLGGTAGNNVNNEMILFQAYHELIDAALVRFQYLTKSLFPFFTEIKSILIQYRRLWNLRHDQKTSFLPIAAKSSISPSTQSMHKCAAFTITYNDKEMLSIWIRYYLKHFPEQDLFILNHHSTAFQSQDQQRSKEYQIFINNIQEKHPNLHIFDLYGEKTGFPMYFFIRTADLYQRRFFRYGYQCTIGTDVDEMIIADPDFYPQGLKEYLKKFMEDSSRQYSRAHGWIIGQLSKVIPPSSSPPLDSKALTKLNEQYLDKRLQWDQPIFNQRFYWSIQPKYSKPVLTKIPVRHYPGFHNFYYPKQVKLDKSLLLIHLRDMDADFCLTREYMKAMICQNTSFQSELSKGLSTHLVNYQEKLAKGEVCPYALSRLFVKNQTVYDNTMTFVMSKIPERYQKVII